MKDQARAKELVRRLMESPDNYFQNVDVLLGMVEVDLQTRFNAFDTLSLPSEDALDSLSDDMALAACKFLESMDFLHQPLADA